MNRIYLLFLLFVSSFVAVAQKTDVLQTWQVGTVVSESDVRRYGITNCFVSEQISEPVFRRIEGKSYKKGCPIPMGELRYLKVLHRNGKGEIQLGEMICHRSIAADLLEIFRALYEAHYPIERMVLIDEYDADDQRSMAANNTSCFNYRKVSGSAKLSKHSRGMAVDINPLYNPYVKSLKGGGQKVQPAEGRPYTQRSRKFPYKITAGDPCHRLFRSRGFIWGGAWRSVKDYQHFEK